MSTTTFLPHFFLILLVSTLPVGSALPSEPDTPCTVDGDCNSPYESCEKLICEHKKVFPIEALEFVGIIVLSIVIAIANSGGIGGGGLVTPINIIFFQFETKAAIALTNFAIFMGGITRYLTQTKQRHPEKDAVCIDYSIASVMLPAALLGTLVGVELNVLFPSSVILLLLTLLLVYLSYNTIAKGIEIRKKENKAKQTKAKETVRMEEPASQPESAHEDSVPEEDHVI